jgi:periplasmic protein TonB
MNNIENLENQDHRPKAFGISIFGFLAFLACLLYFKITYQPDIEEKQLMGIDLNYGVDLKGSGDIQTTNKANASKNNYDVKPEESKVEKEPGKVKPQPVEKVKAVVPKVITKTPPVITSEEENKVTIKKPTEAVKPTAKPAVTPPIKEAKPVVKTEAPKPKPVPERTVDNGSLFKKNKTNGSSTSNGTTGNRDGVGGNNNGDGKKGEVGDQGDKKGTLDGKSLYGTPGKGTGSSGASVSISGWKNRGPLNIPKDNSSETGRIKFKVSVDEDGEIVSINVLESSLSPSITSYYKNQVMKKLKANLIPEGTPPPRSNGTITINITRGE